MALLSYNLIWIADVLHPENALQLKYYFTFENVGYLTIVCEVGTWLSSRQGPHNVKETTRVAQINSKTEFDLSLILVHSGFLLLSTRIRTD